MALTDIVPPVVTGADLDTYMPCGQYTGVPAYSSSVTCGPDTRGRYLYIYLSTFGLLTICEAEVYGTIGELVLMIFRK